MGLSKLKKQTREIVKAEGKTIFPMDRALAVLKLQPARKFDQTIELIVMLGINAKKNETVRGAVVLPHGTGKQVRVAVFAEGADAEKARAAGAHRVGFEDLAEDIKAGNIDFDVLVATPSSMRVVGQLGQILGPRGLMPNPKVGTVTDNVEAAVKDCLGGKVQFRNEKEGILHCPVGKLSFSEQNLSENISAVLNEVKKLKPAASKGVFIKKVYLSSTMGPGLQVDQTTI